MTVRVFPKGQLRRRVVEVRPATVLLTTEEEWKLAQANGQQPLSIGFPLADILELRD